MPTFEATERGDYTIVAPPNVLLANVLVQSPAGETANTAVAYTGPLAIDNPYYQSDYGVRWSWLLRVDGLRPVAASIGSLAGDGGAGTAEIHGVRGGEGGYGVLLMGDTYSDPSMPFPLAHAPGGGGDGYVAKSGLAVGDWASRPRPSPSGVDGVDGAFFDTFTNGAGESEQDWYGGGGGGVTGGEWGVSGAGSEPSGLGRVGDYEEGTYYGRDALVRVQWVEVWAASPPLDGVLETATDLVQVVLNTLGDASGLPLPSAPNSPETATTAELGHLSTSDPNAVVLRGQPQGYTYYEVTVPAYAAVMDLYLYGAQGTSAWGGQGGQLVIQNVPVTGGEVLRVAVGGQASAGDPNPFGPVRAIGGGATWVQRGDYATAPKLGQPNPGAGLIAIAGGGGGGGRNGFRGGDGGGLVGADGEDDNIGPGGGEGGRGGDQVNAGYGLPTWAGQGGWSGGGGDGWRGGEAGGDGILAGTNHGGGGGASSGMTGGLVATVNRQGARSGDGAAVLVFPPRLAPNRPTTLSPSGTVPVLDGPAGVEFQWDYTHPNGPQVAQTGWRFARAFAAGAVFEYWNDTLEVWQLAPHDNDGAVTSFRFPEGAWEDNVAYDWYVAVRDTGPNGSVDGQWSPQAGPTQVVGGDGSIDTGASDYLELALLDHVFNGIPYLPPTTYHIGGFVSPSHDEGGTEQPGAIRSSAVDWTEAAGGVVANANEVTLQVAPNVTLVSLGVFDAPVAGNMLVHVNLDTPIAGGPDGQLFVFAPGDLTISLD